MAGQGEQVALNYSVGVPSGGGLNLLIRGAGVWLRATCAVPGLEVALWRPQDWGAIVGGSIAAIWLPWRKQDHTVEDVVKAAQIAPESYWAKTIRNGMNVQDRLQILEHRVGDA